MSRTRIVYFGDKSGKIMYDKFAHVVKFCLPLDPQ